MMVWSMGSCGEGVYIEAPRRLGATFCRVAERAIMPYRRNERTKGGVCTYECYRNAARAQSAMGHRWYISW
jgi:hypothetical protein